MFPNKFVILWNGQPIGLRDQVYNGTIVTVLPFKASDPKQVWYFETRGGAQNYLDALRRISDGPEYPYSDCVIKEIQFRIV